MQFEIRTGGPADAPAIAALVVSNCSAAVLSFSSVGADNFHEQVARSCAREPSSWLVAIDKTTGVLVGGLELRLSDSSAFVNHVYVAPASRRGGCGRHLLNRAEFLAAGRPLSLDVDSENVAAKNLYRQFGLAVQSLLEWRAAAVAGFVPDGSDAYVSARGTDCGTTLVNRRVVRVPAGFTVWDAEVSQRTVARHGLTDGELLSVCIRPGSERLGRVVRLYERWSQQPAGKGT